jgi:hypothetical protein
MPTDTLRRAFFLDLVAAPDAAASFAMIVKVG